MLPRELTRSAFRVVAAFLSLALVPVSGCREARISGPLRRPVAEREYREVEALEWRARAEESEFAPYLSSEWQKVRARAVVAYARVHRGENPRPLLERWGVEEDSSTRAELVFALRGFDRSSVIEVLESASEDEDVVVRQAVATALRDVRESRELGEKLSQDEDAGVRRRAVLSLAFSQQADASFWSDRLTAEGDQSVRWALYAGAAFEPRLARSLASGLAGAIADRNFLVGAFALEGLTRLVLARDGAARESSLGIAAALDIAGNADVFWIQREAALRFLALRLLHDDGLTDDDRRTIESRLLELAQSDAFPVQPPVFGHRLARSLCAVRDPAVVPRLREFAQASDAGLRTAVADGIADVLASPRGGLRALAPELGGPRRELSLRNLLDDLWTDRHESVRSATSRVTDPGGQAATWARADSSPQVRAAALEASIAAPSPPVISAALLDQSARVRRVALERALRDDLPLDPDTLRSVASDPTPWRWSSRLPAMDLFCDRQPEKSHDFLQAAIRDSFPVVVRHALGLQSPLVARKLIVPDLALESPDSARAALVPGFPLVDRDPVARRRRPRVIVGVDGKPSFVLELYADEAPLHASSFLALARAGYYTGQRVIGIDVLNGVRFERHDGDHHPLLAQPLRPEESLLPFARGSLVSVPVYSHGGERWDAVGEWQITLLPRPDLRGRGTCWGRVYIGMRAVDRLAPGDRIASIEIVD